MPEFGRLEYHTSAGWVVGHAGMALQDPQAYVDGLAKRQKDKEPAPVIARFVTLDENFQPGKVFRPAAVPPFHESPGGAPVTRVKECAACGGEHGRRFECLL